MSPPLSTLDRSTTEHNKTAILRLVDEAINADALDGIAGLFAPRVRLHGFDRRCADAPIDVDQLASLLAGFRVVLPDLHVVADTLLADGDHVTLLWTTTGTNRLTGMRMAWRGVSVYRFEAGCIAEIWTYMDLSSLDRGLAAPVIADGLRALVR